MFKRLFKNYKTPLLVVHYAGRELCRIPKASTETCYSLELNSNEPTLIFEDQKTSYRYDMGSMIEEGLRWVHLSVRVHSNYACQADCLLNDSSQVPSREAFINGAVKAIRFQPFYLPQSSYDNRTLMGQGLFARGFHFSGSITPRNVSLLCICDRCRGSFRLQSFHAGFSELAYFYCSNGPHTLAIGSSIEGAPAVLTEPTSNKLRNLENKLPPCIECGGQFSYTNPLRCPHCGEPYIDFLSHPEIRKNEYYGNYLYGSSLQTCKDFQF